MEIFIFFAGIIVGYFLEKLLDLLVARINNFYKLYHWQKAEKSWQKFQDLSSGLEVIQAGWKNDEFSEEQVILTVEKDYELPADISKRTLEVHQKEWEAAGIKNNPNIGVFSLDPHRISDESSPRGITHELRIQGQTYNYHEFLATNRLHLFGTPEEKAFLEERIGGTPHYLAPVKSFPNPLSVGLSLFCEGGNYLVLTRRSKMITSGGLFWSGSIYNAVGENVSLPKDIEGEHQGCTRLSIWRTARRGLWEEMGIDLVPSPKNFVFHSLVWDKRILDYKFFGYSINSLSRADVRKLWTNAPDRQESWELMFRETSTREQCLELIREIATHREDWGSECMLCTIRSLLHLRKISAEDFEWELGKIEASA